MLGLVLFLLVLPGFVVGPVRNLELLAAWAEVYIRPYVIDGVVETLQINQSLPGLFYRLFTKSPGIEFGDGTVLSVNWVNLDPNTARRVLSLLLLSVIVWLAWVCRAKIEDRRDWRWACEFGMVFIAMLFISERSWKHHYVTMVLPYSAVVSYWVLRCDNKKGWWRVGTILLVALLPYGQHQHRARGVAGSRERTQVCPGLWHVLFVWTCDLCRPFSNPVGTVSATSAVGKYKSRP